MYVYKGHIQCRDKLTAITQHPTCRRESEGCLYSVTTKLQITNASYIYKYSQGASFLILSCWCIPDIRHSSFIFFVKVENKNNWDLNTTLSYYYTLRLQPYVLTPLQYAQTPLCCINVSANGRRMRIPLTVHHTHCLCSQTLLMWALAALLLVHGSQRVSLGHCSRNISVSEHRMSENRGVGT